MQIRLLPAEEDAIQEFVEELWLPYHRELERIVESHELAERDDLVAREVEFRLDRLDGGTHRAWVALDADEEPGTPLADAEGRFAGFVTTDVDESPVVFDRPDRLVVGDIYVREEYRGSGLAEELMGRAVGRADEEGCGELALDVDADNKRAIAFYEKLGFDVHRHRLTVGIEEVATGDERSN